jgi:plastocyanin
MFSLILSSVLFYNIAAAELVPEWIKNTASWYGEGKISETEFLNAIKFLIENNIIVLDLEDIVPSEDVSQESLTASVIIPNGNVEQSNLGFYSPLSLNIQKGITVEWLNEDNVGHTIQSQDEVGNVIPVFNSDVLQTGDVFSYKFDESGVYNYFCTLHPWRVGVINVR